MQNNLYKVVRELLAAGASPWFAKANPPLDKSTITDFRIWTVLKHHRVRSCLGKLCLTGRFKLGIEKATENLCKTFDSIDKETIIKIDVENDKEKEKKVEASRPKRTLSRNH